jgi:hypothetical protein
MSMLPAPEAPRYSVVASFRGESLLELGDDAHLEQHKSLLLGHPHYVNTDFLSQTVLTAAVDYLMTVDQPRIVLA